MIQTIDIKDLRKMLRQDVDRAGGTAAWARQHGVTMQYVSELLRFRKPIGPKVAAALGYEKMIIYARRKK